MNTTFPPAVERVRKALEEGGLQSEIRSFPDSTRTAAEAAATVGVGVGQIVKSLVFLAQERPVLALVSGSNRLDDRRLSQLVGEPVRKADAEAVRLHTGYAIGGVPPTGFPQPIPTYIDRDLLDYDVVWAAAGTPHHVFAIAPAQLRALTSGVVADLRVA
jgi:prolyl-tRNA editing enzyme YbaK/EbsC (Cys-tRNA(Pro) deacylase)